MSAEYTRLGQLDRKYGVPALTAPDSPMSAGSFAVWFMLI